MDSVSLPPDSPNSNRSVSQSDRSEQISASAAKQAPKKTVVDRDTLEPSQKTSQSFLNPIEAKIALVPPSESSPP